MVSESGPNAAAGFGIIGLCGLGLIYDGVTRHLFVQRINNLPTSKAEGAAVGLIELSGKARCHDPTSSPVSKVKCAYYKLIAEYYSPSKYSDWKPIWFDESSGQFYLEDETGKILVDSKGVDLDTPNDRIYEGYISGKGEFGVAHEPMPPEALGFINGLDPDTKADFMAHQHQKVRIMEYYIADGDPLFVLGSAEPQDGSAGGAGVGYRNLVVKKGSDRLLYISDTGERKVVKRLSAGIYWHIFGGLSMGMT